jgi:predicted RNA polymerase sigma factor
VWAAAVAAITTLNDEAPRVEDTDRPQILALYSLLERMSGSRWCC